MSRASPTNEEKESKYVASFLIFNSDPPCAILQLVKVKVDLIYARNVISGIKDVYISD